MNIKENNTIWEMPATVGLPAITAIQAASEESGKYQLCFAKDENCTLEKIRKNKKKSGISPEKEEDVTL